MSLISRNSPRRTRAKKSQDNKRVGEKSPTLGPVVKKIPSIDKSMAETMIEEYKYVPDIIESPEPQQLNRSMDHVLTVPSPESISKNDITFDLLDLSFFCEERIYNILWLPHGTDSEKIKKLSVDYIHNRLSVYSEHTREVQLGSFKETIHFYKGEVLITEEFLNISGFMRKFLDIDRVHVLYETGEILLQDTEYCNFWLDRAQQFFEPKDIPIDRPNILDEEICLDCNLKCSVRHRQQMIN